jgi:hypothetical protein
LDVREDEFELVATALVEELLLETADCVEPSYELNAPQAKVVSEHALQWYQVEGEIVHQQHCSKTQFSAVYARIHLSPIRIQTSVHL